MKIVVALGGNAFLRRGESTSIQAQRINVRRAARALAGLAAEHTLVVTHGNGPQIGLLARQAADAHAIPYPLDVLGAETEGMIGYLLEQELANELGHERVATLLTRTVVRADDPAFRAPTRFIGPVYDQKTAERLAAERSWKIARDGNGNAWRRVVPSLEPTEIVELSAIAHLSGAGFLVICAGGGGVPVQRTTAGTLEGVEGMVDKDLAAATLAQCLGADCLMMLTDVPAVFDLWGTTGARRIRAAHPDKLADYHFAPGSMGPKVEAARRFAFHTGGRAYIGALDDARELLHCGVGTCVSTDISGVVFDEPADVASLPPGTRVAPGASPVLGA
jgi:carbamate kinase